MTFGAAWIAMAITALVPWLNSSPVASLLVYTGLLAGYAGWTEAGRRSAVAYFLAGFFPPLVCFFLLTPFLPRMEPSFFDNGFTILFFVGLGVGFQTHGGPDTPIEAYLPLMWANLLLPIAAVIGGRAFLRYLRHG